MLSALHNLNLKLFGKKLNKIDLLHLLVAPQLNSGWHITTQSKKGRTDMPMGSLCFPLCLCLSVLHNMNLQLCTKQYNKIDHLHLIVAPQLSSGYSTKTRQAGCANEQSMFSLMSMSLCASQYEFTVMY
jgi:hypothetical protein